MLYWFHTGGSCQLGFYQHAATEGVFHWVNLTLTHMHSNSSIVWRTHTGFMELILISMLKKSSNWKKSWYCPIDFFKNQHVSAYWWTKCTGDTKFLMSSNLLHFALQCLATYQLIYTPIAMYLQWYHQKYGPGPFISLALVFRSASAGAANVTLEVNARLYFNEFEKRYKGGGV